MANPRSDLIAEIATLRARVDELECELAYERERNAVPDAEFIAARAIGVPPWAVLALHLLLTQRLVTNESLVAIAEDMGGWEISAHKFSNIVAHRLRRKLRPLGIEIRNDFGVGYSISAEDQARLQAVMNVPTTRQAQQ